MGRSRPFISIASLFVILGLCSGEYAFAVKRKGLRVRRDWLVYAISGDPNALFILNQRIPAKDRISPYSNLQGLRPVFEHVYQSTGSTPHLALGQQIEFEAVSDEACSHWARSPMRVTSLAPLMVARKIFPPGLEIPAASEGSNQSNLGALMAQVRNPSAQERLPEALEVASAVIRCTDPTGQRFRQAQLRSSDLYLLRIASFMAKLAKKYKASSPEIILSGVHGIISRMDKYRKWARTKQAQQALDPQTLSSLRQSAATASKKLQALADKLDDPRSRSRSIATDDDFLQKFKKFRFSGIPLEQTLHRKN